VSVERLIHASLRRLSAMPGDKMGLF